MQLVRKNGNENGKMFLTVTSTAITKTILTEMK